jgi:glycosyltransferase involved in cell wall biosynthesis
MRSQPRFSIVVPAFNEAAYLPRLLHSIATARAAYGCQGDLVEVIVANNMSTDQTGAIAAAHGCRVVSECRRVISAVRNTGAAAARGDILLFVDADSQIHPETLKAIERTLAAGPVVGGATGVRMDRWGPGIAVSFSIQSLWARLTGWDTGVVFCRRADFDIVGGWDETLLFAEDLAFYQALRRLARQRGQRFVRLRGVKTITSARKFEQFGQWRWPLANIRIIWLALVRSPRAHRLIEQYWYKPRR